MAEMEKFVRAIATEMIHTRQRIENRWISISSITYATLLDNGKQVDVEINPENYGLKLAPKDEIVGAGPEVNAQITRDILSGKEKGAKLDIVLINAAAALLVDGKARDLKEGIEIAREAIDSGLANKKLEEIIKYSQRLSC